MEESIKEVIDAIWLAILTYPVCQKCKKASYVDDFSRRLVATRGGLKPSCPHCGAIAYDAVPIDFTGGK